MSNNTDPHEDHSTPNDPADAATLFKYRISKILAAKMATTPNNAFANAYDGLGSLDQIPAFYEEGWIVCPDEDANAICVVEHAWLRTEGGIIDPSLVWWLDRQRIKETSFFVGLSYSHSQLMEVDPVGLPTARYQTGIWSDGMEVEAYRAAYEQALAHAHLLAEQTTPAKPVVIVNASPPPERGSSVGLLLHRPAYRSQP